MSVDTEAEHEEVERLLAFLRERDASCPLCGYNLRNLTRPVCPECRQELVLAVGVRRLRLAWFLVALAPSIFSGIAAALLILPIIIVPLRGGGFAPWPIMALDAFGWTSGLAGLLLVHRRVRFLALPLGAQQAIAAATWSLHVGLTLLLIVMAAA